MKDDGGSAFPLAPIPANMGRDQDRHGMTLRDYFAAAALQGMLANPAAGVIVKDGLYESAYFHADEMLKAREPQHDGGNK